MDIAFVVTEFPSISETFILNQIIGLLSRGHHVDIFAQSGSRQAVQQPEIEEYRLLEKTFYLSCPASRWLRLLQGARWCARKFPRKAGPVLGSLNVLRYGRYALSLSLLFATLPFYREYDIVHCQFGANGNFGAILKKLRLQKRLVVTFHGCDIRRGLEQGGSLYRDLWQEADRILAISPYNYEHLLRLGGDPDKIIYHPVGIDCHRFRYRPPELPCGRPVRVLSVARLVKEKGLAFGIRALHRLRQKRGDLQVQYTIVGEGRLRGQLEQLVRELDLASFVHLPGAMNQDAILQLLQGSDIFMAPSLVEALPVSLMEAQAVGLPVVATRVGSVDQIVTDGRSGWLVPAGDAGALAEKLDLLITNPGGWAAMGRNGRRQVERRYDIERLNDRLVRLYEDLLAA